MNKTLVGKNNYLFLINDDSKELQQHCDNLSVTQDPNLSRYTFNNFFITVFPDKSVQCKDYLPDNYKVKYRPGLEIYLKKFKNKLLDAYQFLKDTNDIFYKTDTHMNLKSCYMVYCEFIRSINVLYNLNLTVKPVKIEQRECILTSTGFGIGDLTWPTNLGTQELDDVNDTYYFSNEVPPFYNSYKINNSSNIRILSYDLEDKTSELEDKNEFLHWNIISKYIIHKETNPNAKKVVVFYDSFLLSTLPLYIDLFENVYFIKDVFNTSFLNKIKPDYVFEFRVERFLC
jgi:hypothetical protein